MWPNSCNTTQAKSAMMKSTPSRAAGAPPLDQWMAAIQASNRKNVKWMRTAVPPTSKSLIDQPMARLRRSQHRPHFDHATTLLARSQWAVAGEPIGAAGQSLSLSAGGGALLLRPHQLGTGPDGARHARVLGWIGDFGAQALGRMPDPARIVEEGARQ